MCFKIFPQALCNLISLHIIYSNSWNNVKKPLVLVSAWLFVGQRKMLRNSAIRERAHPRMPETFLFTCLVQKTIFEAASVTSHLRPLTLQPVCGDNPNIILWGICSSLYAHSSWGRDLIAKQNAWCEIPLRAWHNKLHCGMNCMCPPTERGGSWTAC